MVPFSILDLSPIVQGGTADEALQRTLDLARHAGLLGYCRSGFTPRLTVDASRIAA